MAVPAKNIVPRRARCSADALRNRPMWKTRILAAPPPSRRPKTGSIRRQILNQKEI
jgi:hypothetical protein